MTSSSFLFLVCFFISFASCVQHADQKTDNINFKDSITKTSIYFADNSDTTWQYDTIYFTPANADVYTADSFYEAYELNSSNDGVYKIWFQKKNVIAFCDSMLTVNPQLFDVYGNDVSRERTLYKYLKEQALKDKIGKDEININYGLTTLLDRFSPLILNRDCNPKYIIVSQKICKHDNLISCNLKMYYFKGRYGDTLTLAETIGDVELKDFDTTAKHSPTH